MNEPSQTILVVEDNPDDVFGMERALELAKIANPLQVATDGQQALDYLSGTGQFGDRTRHPIPFIIFLDLKLPYVDGFELLSWIRRQPALESTIVIILTGSQESKDHERTYALGARSYLAKPPTPEALHEIFDSLKSYWVSKTGVGPVMSSQS